MRLIWPLRLPVIVTRDFWAANSLYYLGVHYAIDIVRMWASTYLADVIAPGDGQAMAVPFYDRYRGYYVIWAGPNGWRMHVAHLASFNIPVGVWVPVKQGAVMGFADNTGASAGYHAHIDWINPTKLGSEAVYKPPLGGYAHDVSKWINVDLGWPPTPAQEETDMIVFKATGQNRFFAIDADGYREVVPAEAWVYTTAGVRQMERPLSEIMLLPPSPAQWLRSLSAVPDGQGNKITVQQLFEWSRTAEELNRFKWHVGEGNFPAGTTPLDAFKQSVAAAE